MNSLRNNLQIIFLAALMFCLWIEPGLAQKRGRGVSSGDSSAETTTAPKRGKGVSVTPAESRAPIVITNTVVREIKPNEGALVLVAVPAAQVNLTAQRAGKPGKTLSYKISQDNGTLTLASVFPGAYKLSITHPDFNSFTSTVTIERGKPTTVAPELISKYGTLIIGGLPKDVSVWLDGKPMNTSVLRVDDQGRMQMPRLPAGEHTLKFSRAGYDDWVIEKLTVRPGETLPLTARMNTATVMLTVKARVGTEIYLDNVSRGAVQPDGSLKIPALPPGDYKLRAWLDGYETLEKPLKLTLDKRQALETIELVPIAESSEATDNFRQGLTRWFPAPSAWKTDKGTLLVSGDAPALFRDATEARPFNVYRDFTWDFDVSFRNGKGAAWIIRAKDARNYYLVELTTTKSRQQRRLLNFYLCRDGRLELKDSRDVVENLEKPGDSFHLTVKVTGNQFIHTITVASSPGNEAQPLGTFTDNTFSYGGIGFQAINGADLIVRSFVIIPTQKAGTLK